MTVLSPLQFAHEDCVTNWPSGVWRAERTTPVPPQRSQEWTSVPGSAPLPLHVSQAARCANVTGR